MSGQQIECNRLRLKSKKVTEELSHDTSIEENITRGSTQFNSSELSEKNCGSESTDISRSKNFCLINNRYEIDKKLYRFGGQARVYKGMDHWDNC